MAVTARELREWLDGMPDTALIGIDEDGMTLLSSGDGYYDYYEIGGMPAEGPNESIRRAH